ncbi:MAG: TRAP transporter substrate-binding protein DctP [Proteobacteria bacterium]|nr:TRAP transporter substrate-binding protein DctP [Pseudomonadota bacterium]
MTRRWGLGLLAAGCVLGAMAFAPPVAHSQDKKVYELTFAWDDIWGPKFRASQVYAPGGVLQRMLYERSGGRLQLKIIPRMFPSTDIFQAVAQGKADLGDVPMPWHSGTYPLWNWGEIPGIVSEDPVQGLAEELAVYQDPRVRKIYDDTMGKLNLKYWFVTQWDPANGIWSKKMIEGLDDLKGLKVRAGGSLPTIGLKALGMGPVTISGSELAPAMMAGTIDAVLTSLGYGYSIGLAQASKCFTLTPLSPTWTAVTVVNKKKFDALPADLQKIFLEVGREVEQMVSLSTTAEYILSADAVELSGVKRVQLSKEDREKALQLVKPVEEEWLKQTGKEGAELLAVIRDVVAKYRSFTGK